jgi:hypothetical protein
MTSTYDLATMHEERADEHTRLAKYRIQRANVYACSSNVDTDWCMSRADELDALIDHSLSEITRLTDLMCDTYRAEHPLVVA